MTSSTGASFSTKILAATTIAMLAMPTIGAAEDVQLHAHDGSTHISGDLVSYQDGRYTLNTALGTFLIAARIVACEGDTCPSETQVLSDIAAAGDLPFDRNAVASNLVPASLKPCAPASGSLKPNSDC